jgi:hypothetical protein
MNGPVAMTRPAVITVESNDGSLAIASVSLGQDPHARLPPTTLDRFERAATLPKGDGHVWGWVALQHAVAAVLDRDAAEVRLRPRGSGPPRVVVEGPVPVVSVSQHGRHAVAAAWTGRLPPRAALLLDALRALP